MLLARSGALARRRLLGVSSTSRVVSSATTRGQMQEATAATTTSTANEASTATEKKASSKRRIVGTTEEWEPPAAKVLSSTDPKLDAISAQLGYRPSNVLSVAYTNATTGRPCVLRLYPLKSATNAYKAHQRASVEPFPTLYWMACPVVSAAFLVVRKHPDPRLVAGEGSSPRRAPRRPALACR